jgi:hypothetical protein
MGSLAAETQLEKDTESVAGVIPIYPWIENGKPKDNIPPRTYARMLFEAKGREAVGRIVQCNSDGCEGGIGKGMFWRSVETGENMVPTGWSNYGGPGQFTICALCKASDVENGFGYEELELGRVDDNLSHGGPGGTDSDKPSSTIPTVSLGASSSPSSSSPPRGSKRKRQPTLIERANELFKNKLSPKDLEALEKKIREDINKDRLEAAERRREEKKGGKRRRKKRTRKRRKSRRKSRRKKRTKRRR